MNYDREQFIRAQRSIIQDLLKAVPVLSSSAPLESHDAANHIRAMLAKKLNDCDC